MKNTLIVLVVASLFLFSIFYIRNKSSKKNVELGSQMTTQKTSVRPPAVAGSFYPADKNLLKKQVATLLSSSKQTPLRQDLEGQLVKLLLIPHAGYNYSGNVAAPGFNLIKGQKIARVIIIGDSHQELFQGAQIDDSGQWQTPLGKTEVDISFAEKLIDQENKIAFSSKPHQTEHSLEVQLPFLQTVLKSFKIVPILLSHTTTDSQIEKLVLSITENLDDKTLVLISTDLSHYPNYEVAQQVDKKTIDSILSGIPEQFDQTRKEQLEVDYPNLETCACAKRAVKAGMLIAQKLNQEVKGNWQLIKYANSGDTPAGDKSQVVGYTSIAWTQEIDTPEASKEKQSQNGHTLEQKALLLKIARKTLESYLKDKTKPEYQITDPKLSEKLGAFVTLNKDGKLRGCIGEFSPAEEPLWQVVQNRVIDAALNDPRFSPVTLEELSKIEIEVSILSVPKKIDDWKKIEIGVHGVVIRQGARGGTFLPQVAADTGWTREEFLSQLCSQKAGLPANCYQNSKTEILVYTAEVFSENELL